MMRCPTRSRWPAAAFASMALALASAASAQSVLERSRATYGALRSYADEGEITVEQQLSGGRSVERHTFRTSYRSPRNFLLEFVKDPSRGAERLVVWCDGGDFQSWWSVTGVHEVYSGGRGTAAFATAVLPTSGAAYQIPPLLFPAAKMSGPLTGLDDVRDDGMDDIDGRRAHRITGLARGHFGPARPTTVWIDAETLLVRRIVEETPHGTPGGQVHRVTTTFRPTANPSLGDDRFRFDPAAHNRASRGGESGGES